MTTLRLDAPTGCECLGYLEHQRAHRWPVNPWLKHFVPGGLDAVEQESHIADWRGSRSGSVEL